MSQAVTQSWRYPRLQMLANGNIIKGAKSAEVTSYNNYHAAEISGEVSLSADPAFGMAWWDGQTDITVDVQLSIGESPAWQSVITGKINHINIDAATNSLRFDGHDLTAAFQNARTQATYANQTSSQIAATLAAEHGMTVVATPTKTLVGQYYQLEHDRITLDNMSRQTTEWDLLTYLAQEEDFSVWVMGNTLYFQPPAANTNPPFQVIYTPSTGNAFSPTLNVERVSLERSLTLAKDIKVTVKSTNLRTGKVYTRTAQANGSAYSTETVQNYVITKPGLTPDQALKLAQSKLTELSQHERILHIEMPGELTLTPQDMVQLSGTGSGFDMKYYIDQITRSIDFDEGFTQRLRCKNSSPRTQVAGP